MAAATLPMNVVSKSQRQSNARQNHFSVTGLPSHLPAQSLSVRNTFKGFSGLIASNLQTTFFGEEINGAFQVSFGNSRMGKKRHATVRSVQVRASLFKVAILGAAGGIGQPLSLLIKMSPLVSELNLYDIANVKGVVADLSHCNTPAQVLAFTGTAELGDSLKGVDVVVIPAGVPRKPGMTRDDLFNINAGIVKILIEAVADNCPNAFVHIISNPVNSTVPIAAEVLRQKGVYNPKKLFGVTTLDVVRANTFVARKKNLRLIDVDVPVIGGHAGITILPLLSKTRPSVTFTQDEVEELTLRIQNAGTEVVEAKAGAGSATLSMAYAAARFIESSLRALDGDPDVFDCSYVQSELTELPFFASRVKLGKQGIEGFVVSDAEGLTEYEQKALQALKPELKASIEKASCRYHVKIWDWSSEGAIGDCPRGILSGIQVVIQMGDHRYEHALPEYGVDAAKDE
ncbi:malate dehydrogenase, chloroplastic isoform X2 [Cryptomeria japonica]|uniref:malate dehydrogenase, chloroplastic isoform X2 n=1 Tax=Cryptomeria japonica TaxID=3369 RepID=UPI0027DA3E60|nr:malate dehydrogenase, chloroplastic isoform X2 [Cryptomeria japonica]